MSSVNYKQKNLEGNFYNYAYGIQKTLQILDLLKTKYFSAVSIHNALGKI